MSHSWTYYNENSTYSHTIFHILLMHFLFWVKMIPHWLTFEVKNIPIHILGGLTSIPHSRRTSVYTSIMEETPRVDLSRTKCKRIRLCWHSSFIPDINCFMSYNKYCMYICLFLIKLRLWTWSNGNLFKTLV